MKKLRPDLNPKHAVGLAKQPYRFIPPAAIAAEGRVMAGNENGGGAMEYGPFNWNESGVLAGVYYDAIKRHLEAWWTGQDLDPKSRESHLAHIRACAGILFDAQGMGTLVDDRPIGKTMPLHTHTPKRRKR